MSWKNTFIKIFASSVGLTIASSVGHGNITHAAVIGFSGIICFQVGKVLYAGGNYLLGKANSWLERKKYEVSEGVRDLAQTLGDVPSSLGESVKQHKQTEEVCAKIKSHQAVITAHTRTIMSMTRDQQAEQLPFLEYLKKQTEVITALENKKSGFMSAIDIVHAKVAKSMFSEETTAETRAIILDITQALRDNSLSLVCEIERSYAAVVARIPATASVQAQTIQDLGRSTAATSQTATEMARSQTARQRKVAKVEEKASVAHAPL